MQSRNLTASRWKSSKTDLREACQSNRSARMQTQNSMIFKCIELGKDIEPVFQMSRLACMQNRTLTSGRCMKSRMVL